MPRPKVKPMDRQRSVRACVSCKRSKIRCDAEQPCAMCKRRGRAEECIYEPAQSRRASRVSQDASLKSPATEVDSVIQQSSTTSTKRLRIAEEPAEPSNDGASQDEQIESPRSRMLLSAKLHKVYIGETASISYLQFLRRMIRNRIGACPFTENEFSNFMLETDVVPSAPDGPVILNLAQTEALAKAFFDATSGILDLYSPAEVASTLRQQTPSDGGFKTAHIYLILAVGAQCRGTEPLDLQLASNFFSKGRALAFQSMLIDPSLEMISDFLIMAFYMLGACNRNAGYMYLGVASKAANALGLHRIDQYRDIPDEECRLRLSVWKSCRVLDMIVNAILGRYSGSPSSRQEERFLHTLSQSIGDTSSIRSMAIQATFDICPFMDELERSGGSRSKESAENFLERLQGWSKALPQDLRRWTGSSPTATAMIDQERYLGASHVACVYYFAVMLTTRRFLTIYLMPKVRGKLRNGASTPQQQSSPREAVESEGLAHVCLNAAINLAKVGHNAKRADRMLRNMCLIKAWMFAAGLLLGFSLFAQPDHADREVEEAFHQARDVLHYLAALSPQAEHYHEILGSFYDAIEAHRAKATSHRRRAASRFMDQLFTSADVTGNPAPAPESMPSSVGTDASGMGLASGAPVYMDGLNFGAIGLTSDVGLDDVQFAGYDGPPLDDFGLDWQPFAPFFDDLM